MDTLKISIITVSYNVAKTIEQTILSVVNQTYNNIEYIIIDGGSTDGTIDIIKKYEDKIAYWVSEPDNGIYDAMNKGIDYATGDYILFIHAGDLLRSNILFEIEKYLVLYKNKYAFLYGNVYMTKRKIIYDGKFNKFKISLSNISQQAILYSRNIFNIVNKHNLIYKVYADHELNIRCFANSKIEKVYMNIIVSDFDENGFSSFAKDENFNRDRYLIIKEKLGRIVCLYCWVCRKIIYVKKIFLSYQNI